MLNCTVIDHLKNKIPRRQKMDYSTLISIVKFLQVFFANNQEKITYFVLISPVFIPIFYIQWLVAKEGLFGNRWAWKLIFLLMDLASIAWLAPKLKNFFWAVNWIIQNHDRKMVFYLGSLEYALAAMFVATLFFRGSKKTVTEKYRTAKKI